MDYIKEKIILEDLIRDERSLDSYKDYCKNSLNTLIKNKP